VVPICQCNDGRFWVESQLLAIDEGRRSSYHHQYRTSSDTDRLDHKRLSDLEGRHNTVSLKHGVRSAARVDERGGPLTQMRMVPKRPGLVRGGELVQEGIVSRDRALGNEGDLGNTPRSARERNGWA
jgi:hypothetical protein